MYYIEDTIAKMLNAIKYIPEQFGENLDDDWSKDVQDMEHRLHKEFPNAYIAHGVSKCAIVNDSCDWVIKIPFNGSYYYSYDDEDDDFEEEVWEEFCFANNGYNEDSNCWDYCENELLKYEKAVEDGFGDFFAETKFYGYKNNCPVYIQKKAISVSEGGSSTRPASKEAIDTFQKRKGELYTYIDSNWLVIAIDYYGFDRVVEFINYLRDNKLYDDLHTGNLGFTADGRPVLIDWAGWRD